MNVISALEAGRRKIQAGWCQGRLWDHLGNVCALGALLSAGGDTETEFWAAVSALTEDGVFAGTIFICNNQKNDAIADFNNTHTKKDVLALYDRTIARLKAERGVEKLKELTVIPVQVPVKESVDG